MIDHQVGVWLWGPLLREAVGELVGTGFAGGHREVDQAWKQVEDLPREALEAARLADPVKVRSC